MKNTFLIAAFAAAVALAAPAFAVELKVAAADTVESVANAQKGKRVTVRLRSGQEVTGTVVTVTNRVVQLGSVAGKEFFDAVVPLEAIEAIFVRTKE
jgi:hypothetical protein